MMIKLENELCKVEFSSHAAEITSFIHKEHEIEYIWSGDKKYWRGRNPILFPIIGSSYDGKYHFNGRTSEMGNHGILRDAKFDVVEQSEDKVIMEFIADDVSFRLFPFYFRMQVTYELDQTKLKVSYRIFNEGVIDLPCNFGLHPAFNCPLTHDKKFEDYKVVFPTPEKLKGSGPFSNNGYIKEIPLSYSLFEEHDENTFVYYGINAPTIGITDGKHGVDISHVGFPVTAIWTPNAPFVCLEPWNGLGKVVEKDLPFEERDATIKVGPERSRLFTYTIEIY